MAFFATFSTWLDASLITYVGDNTARVSAAIEPALVTVGTLYVMVWGYLQLTGKIEEPFITGLRRIVLLVVVLGGALQLWLYNTVIVNTFYDAPAQLAASVVGAASPISSLDVIWQQAGTAAVEILKRGSLLQGWGFIVLGFLIWIVMGLMCCYAMFLIALSKVALVVLIALGPLFIGFRLFEGTRRLFDAWLMQLANYALVTILTVMLSALTLSLVQTFATQTAGRGAAIQIVDTADMLLVAVIVLLVLLQVMPIAASLAGGGSLSTMSAVSRGTGALWRGAVIERNRRLEARRVRQEKEANDARKAGG